MSEFVELIKKHLAEDRKDIADDGDELPSEAAVQMCIRLAECIADVVESHPNVNGAVFVDDDRVVSIVLHSKPSDRQVTYEMARGGKTIAVRSIDENMQTRATSATIEDVHLLRRKAEWVAGEAT